MLYIGRHNTLTVAHKNSGGYVLGAPPDEVFLPRQHAPKDVAPGTELQVFVYADARGELIATTQRAHASVGEFAYLKCVEVNAQGAFLDWGIPKDLFVPFAEQHVRMVEGRSYVVILCLDRRVDRPMASSKLGPFFDYDIRDLVVGDEQNLLVFGHNDAGAQVVVDQRHIGLIYTDATFRELPVGLELTGYIAALRADNRIDISLTPPDNASLNSSQMLRAGGERSPAQAAILGALERAGGFLPVHDKSAPAEILRLLGLSKTVFKRNAGALYKARLIRIESDGIHLLESDRSDAP